MRSTEVVDFAHRWALAADADRSPGIDELRSVVRGRAPLLGDAEVDELVAAVLARIDGLGPLDALLTDPSVTDVLVNGPGPVWVERHGRLEVTDVEVGVADLELLVERIVAPLGRRADRSAPIAEARLPDGSRAHIVLEPVAVDGTCLAIRRFAPRPFPLRSYTEPAIEVLLRQAVDRGDNVLVSGGTGSGKTSLLNALASLIDPAVRIVTVEDAAELAIEGDHVVRFECRPPNGEGAGAVELGALVRSALRLRPDRIVVGEVRGGEAFDLVQALNTGHAGSMTTCHANDPVGALRRLEMLVLMGAPAVPLVAVRELLAASVDLVVQVGRTAGEARRIQAVHEVVGVDAAGDLATRALACDGQRLADRTRPARLRHR